MNNYDFLNKHKYYKVLNEDAEQFEKNIDDVLYSKFDNFKELQCEEHAEELVEFAKLEYIKEGTDEGVQEIEELSNHVAQAMEQDNYKETLSNTLKSAFDNWNSVRKKF